MTEHWDPLECETELVCGYIVDLDGVLFMVLYLSDAGSDIVTYSLL